MEKNEIEHLDLSPVMEVFNVVHIFKERYNSRPYYV